MDPRSEVGAVRTFQELASAGELEVEHRTQIREWAVEQEELACSIPN